MIEVALAKPSVTFAVPAIRDGSEDGAEEVSEILYLTLSYKTEGTPGAIWLTNLSVITESNERSIINCKNVAQWLSSRAFQQDVELTLHQPHKKMTGTSWTT
ncbi:MAG: hypothetical protein MN733_18365 [Nitrososphaera sp.]|nr:hypothetical protein [Nitrososphaera sp.]